MTLLRKLFYLLPIIIGYTKIAIAQTTLYFVQIRQVEGERISKGDNSCLYLTINDKGCYDSDKYGMTVGNGFLNYMGESGGIRNYYGDSFWGLATYRLKTDFSRLNIVNESNRCVYVYERRNIGEAISITSSKIKEKKKPQKTDVVVMPVMPMNPEVNKPLKSEFKDVVCPTCNGTGLVIRYIPAAAQNEGSRYCGYCHLYIKNTDWHIHQTCSHCNGRKYIKN